MSLDRQVTGRDRFRANGRLSGSASSGKGFLVSIAPTARVTGTVVETLVQSGNKNGRDWSIRTARVLVGKADLCEVQLPDTKPTPADGTSVDWRVRLGNPGGYLRVSLVDDWPTGRSVKAAG